MKSPLKKFPSISFFHSLRFSIFRFVLLGTVLVPGGCATHLSHKNHGTLSRAEIQKIVDEVVEDSKKSLKPKGLCVLIANPHTGEILAKTGDAVRSLTEPVSTFKPVAVVAAFEEGKISDETRIDCELGAFRNGNHTIRDFIPLGPANPQEILAIGSNIGVTKIALLLDDEKFYHYSRRFGFGEKTGISVPGEIPGLLKSPDQWGAETKARMAIGQYVAATPIQIAMAYCAIANGGKLMRPVLGSEKPRRIRRVCSEKTANKIKAALKAATEEGGAAPLAQVKGLSVAGSPGTAQAVSEKGGYAPGKFVTMFAGFFPADHPKYVVVVVVDQADLPPSLNYGGSVAAPLFAKIAGKIHGNPEQNPLKTK
jgi:cell division protein FtsI (penicillin-binding protein 3)